MGKKITEEKSREDSMKEGIALALTFLALSAFLYIFPDYFHVHIVSKIISVIFGIIGIMALGLELNKVSSNEKKLGLDNLGVGLGLGAIWGILYYYFPYWWVNILGFTILMLAVYGIVLGLIGIIMNIFSNDLSLRKTILIKVPIAITQILGFTLTLLQVLQIIQII